MKLCWPEPEGKSIEGNDKELCFEGVSVIEKRHSRVVVATGANDASGADGPTAVLEGGVGGKGVRGSGVRDLHRKAERKKGTSRW